jgi:hypothetical protein
MPSVFEPGRRELNFEHPPEQLSAIPGNFFQAPKKVREAPAVPPAEPANGKAARLDRYYQVKASQWLSRPSDQVEGSTKNNPIKSSIQEAACTDRPRGCIPGLANLFSG